jgi:hypothetical protein
MRSEKIAIGETSSSFENLRRSFPIDPIVERLLWARSLSVALSGE